MFKNKSIIITGGTGSFGKFFVEYILKNFQFKKIIIFSRDEFKQNEFENKLKNKFSSSKISKLRFYLGDVRDKNRLIFASSNADIMIHAAALKQVPVAEKDPFEFIKTNIWGAQNVVEASIHNNIKKIIALSTDKAASPINLYGATKLCSDKLFSSANNIVGNRDIKFSVVRYGNVMASRGSVIEVFKNIKQNERIPITSTEMTRFNITLDEAVKMVLWSLKNMIGGEVFVPKIPSYKITDLARAILPKNKFKIIGIRPGEKIHEELITESDMDKAYDLGKYYVIINTSILKSVTYYKNKKKCKINNSYNSLSNKDYLNVKEIKEILKKNNII